MTIPPPSSAPFHSACAVPEPARRAEILRAVRKRARSLSLSKRRAPNLSITHQLWQNVVFVSRVLVKKLQICTRIFSRGHGMAHAKTRRTRRRAGFSVGAPPRGRPPPQTRKQTRADTGVCVRDAHNAPTPTSFLPHPSFAGANVSLPPVVEGRQNPAPLYLRERGWG